MRTPPDLFDMYHRELRTLDVCTAEKERGLLQHYHETGDVAARNELVKTHLRFVVKLAKRFSKGDSASLSGYISAGNEGLLVATDKYCPWVIVCSRCLKKTYTHQTKHQRCRHCNRALKHGDAKQFTTRFLTYAAWWILEAMRTEMYRMEHAVHVPSHKIKELQQRRQRGEQPQGIVGVSYDDVAEEDRRIETSDGVTTTLQHQLRRGVQRLNPRQAYVVTAYFGLRGDRPKTLRQISAVLSVCPERVRQLKAHALEVLQDGMAVEAVA